MLSANTAVPQRISQVRVDVLGVEVAMRFPQLPGLQLPRRGGVVPATSSATPRATTSSRTTRPGSRPSRRLKQRSLAEARSSMRRRRTTCCASASAWRLTHESPLDDEARRIMEAMPLIPAPTAGHFVSVATLKAEVEAGRPVRFATREYPRGSTPDGTVLLTPRDPREVGAAAARQETRRRRGVRAAQAAQRREPRPAGRPRRPKTPFSARRSWLSMAVIDTPKLKGQVGLLPTAEGAFVRLLAQGRFLQQGRSTAARAAQAARRSSITAANISEKDLGRGAEPQAVVAGRRPGRESGRRRHRQGAREPRLAARRDGPRAKPAGARVATGARLHRPAARHHRRAALRMPRRRPRLARRPQA